MGQIVVVGAHGDAEAGGVVDAFRDERIEQQQQSKRKHIQKHAKGHSSLSH